MKRGYPRRRVIQHNKTVLYENSLIIYNYIELAKLNMLTQSKLRFPSELRPSGHPKLLRVNIVNTTGLKIISVVVVSVNVFSYIMLSHT